MDHLKGFSVKIRNFKCFGEQEQGFDEIAIINLVIGRNNSGKSALLDLVDYLVKGTFDFPRALWHEGNQPQIIAESPLSEDELREVFREDTYGGLFPGPNHWVFGKQFVGTSFRWVLNGPKNSKYCEIGVCANGERPFDGINGGVEYLQNLAERKQNPFAGKEFRRIFAERNITPEGDSGSNLEVSGDGRGVTNIIQNFINKANLRSDLVESTLLHELNVVFKTDATFTDIVCQQLDTGVWEIYLEEENKGRVPLSQSGSGIKTVILVLVYIHLVPTIAKKELSQFVFGFEELENNLHPALLRRLLSYLYQTAKKFRCIFFLTTHSNVEIDMFSKNDDAQIVHVTHDGKQAYSKKVGTYIDNKGVLDDLDVRASDLLQSNGIVWVEGPSDRIYINRWIDLWSDGKISEGTHYQCVFYGGRLLSHLSGEDPQLVQDGVSILTVNTNAVILIDSDKRTQQSRLNNTKKRIIEEIQQVRGMAWVTKGKEIENYISGKTIERWLKLDNVKQVGQYENFFDYMDAVQAGVGRRYAQKKSLLAEQLSPLIAVEDIESVLDLREKLDEICGTIRGWNS